MRSLRQGARACWSVQDIALGGQSFLVRSHSFQASYKAYRDPETGEPAPLSMVVGELGVMFIAGTSNGIRKDDHATHDRNQAWRTAR